MSATDRQMLIVGAGPTGLAAALFLAHAGLRPRIIERDREPSPFSKALGVNPRTLDLLEPTGVTEQLLAQGLAVRAANVWRHGRRLARIEFTGAHERYPFMLIHGQSRSERLLEEALAERGIVVERGVSLTGIEPGADRLVVEVERHGEPERLEADCLLGADGAHSRVRAAMGIDFPGFVYDEPWQLYDLELDPPLDPDKGHVFMLDDGGMFVIRLEGRVWRVIGRPRALLDRLPEGTERGEIFWESEFRIAHRLAASFGDGRVSLAGDAAHIHSPLGGRGMNLGVEDAYVWARLAAEGRLHDYARLRQPIDAALVRTVARMTEIPRGLTRHARFVRHVAPVLAPLMPLATGRLRTWVLGLDHPVKLD